MKKYRGLSLKKDYIWKKFLLKGIITGKNFSLKGLLLDIFSLKKDYIWKFFLVNCKNLGIIFLDFPLYLFLYTAIIFLKQVGGCKKFFTRKNDFFGGGVFFGNWIYRGYVKKFLPEKFKSLG